MDAPKYIIVDMVDFGPTVFVFPAFVEHAAFFNRFSRVGDNLLSAGFVSLGGQWGFHCYGESVSLKVKSRPEDSRLVSRQMGLEVW